MNNWPSAPLGDVCELVGGGTPSRKRPDYFVGSIPWATPTDVTALRGRMLTKTREAITATALRDSSARLVPAGTVLLTSRATIGFAAIAAVPLATNQGFANFICGPRIEAEYLAYWFETQREQLIRLAGGTTFKEITKGTLRKISVPLPPLAEQRRIVDILDRAASIRRLRQQAQDTARLIIPALFNKMFGDPATNPMGWPVATLGHLADVQGGLQVTTARAALPLERPYLRVANVLRDALKLHEIKHIRLTPQELNRVKLRVGDLLVVEGHGNPNEVGRVAIWDGSIPDCVHQNHLIRVRCGQKCTPAFVAAFLNSIGGRRILIGNGKTTSGLNTISVSNVKAVFMPVPPLSLQREFEQIVVTVEQIARSQTRAEGICAAATAAVQSRILG